MTLLVSATRRGFGVSGLGNSTPFVVQNMKNGAVASNALAFLASHCDNNDGFWELSNATLGTQPCEVCATSQGYDIKNSWTCTMGTFSAYADNTMLLGSLIRAL